MLKNVKERPLIRLRTSDYVSVSKYLKLYSTQKNYISINSNKIDYKNRHNWPTLFNNYDVSIMGFGPYQVINNLDRLAVTFHSYGIVPHQAKSSENVLRVIYK